MFMNLHNHRIFIYFKMHFHNAKVFLRNKEILQFELISQEENHSLWDH